MGRARLGHAQGDPRRCDVADRARLEAVVANRNSPQKDVWRAKIILLTAEGLGNAILRGTGRCKSVV
jgi:hypothetical protein